MSEIIYRKLKKEDYNEVEEIINQSFGLYHYVDNPKMLNMLLKSYLQSCLAEKTFDCVAQKDGKVVGVILGNSKSDYKIFSHFKPTLAMIYYGILMNFQSLKCKEKADDYKNLHKIYAEFLKNRKNQFDGVLTLFAVSEDCRGLGVGKNLLSLLVEYLKKNNTTNIYLFTDTTCNYGFYDSQGFKRIDEKQLTITCSHKPMDIGVFLYGYKIK
ncbi:MAG: GNAT family N-acetyltransferase [Oscillospiraceae bacterium]